MLTSSRRTCPFARATAGASTTRFRPSRTRSCGTQLCAASRTSMGGTAQSAQTTRARVRQPARTRMRGQSLWASACLASRTTITPRRHARPTLPRRRQSWQRPARRRHPRRWPRRWQTFCHHRSGRPLSKMPCCAQQSTSSTPSLWPKWGRSGMSALASMMRTAQRRRSFSSSFGLQRSSATPRRQR